MLSYLEGKTADRPIDFVFNGDTFDLLKTPYLDQYPHHITKDVAVGKMSAVAAAHPKFFEAVSRILDSDQNRQVHFILGNHDMELAFPKVQNFLRALCGNPERVEFPGFSLSIGPVYFEHGSQADPLFHVDPQKLFIDSEQGQLLNLSWASIALLDLVIPMQKVLYFQERLRPKSELMERIPEIRELILGLAWNYYTKNFWRELLATKDPVLKLNWTMIKEIIRRITLQSPDVAIPKTWINETLETHSNHLFVLGHLHQRTAEFIGNKRVLQAGAFRDEYSILDEGKAFRPLLKSFLEIYLKDDQVVRVVTKEVLGPPRDEPLPASMFEVLPQVKQMLEDLGETENEKEKRKKQEQKEAKSLS
jgi:UDP-2,3-diacylglucosamine pyrophosphatase LpxH